MVGLSHWHAQSARLFAGSTRLLDRSDTERSAPDLGTLAGYVPGFTFSPFSQDQNILSIRGDRYPDDAG
jgi:hypothetical protein